MPPFPDETTLAALQHYQAAVCQARGWDQTTDLEAFMLLMEEVGELAKAMRRHRNLYTEAGTPPLAPSALADEFADVLSYLMELANRHGVDLTAAYQAKEARNAGRSWQ